MLNESDKLMLLNSYTAEELQDMFGYDFAMMKNFDQRNPHHAYDLLTHTLKTTVNLGEYCHADLDIVLLKVASLFHDIGKPQVAKEKNGRNVYYGHAERSAELASPTLFTIGFEKHEIDLILFYIRHHDDFISFKLKDENSDIKNPYIVKISVNSVKSRIKSVRKKATASNSFVPSKKDYINLLSLCCADASAQNPSVVIDGICVDSNNNKIKRMTAIKKIIETELSF